MNEAPHPSFNRLVRPPRISTFDSTILLYTSIITSNLHQLKAFGSGFQANAARRMRRTKLRSFKLGRVLKNATGGDGRRNIAAGPAASVGIRGGGS